MSVRREIESKSERRGSYYSVLETQVWTSLSWSIGKNILSSVVGWGSTRGERDFKDVQKALKMFERARFGKEILKKLPRR